jgi:hypothetical protein
MSSLTPGPVLTSVIPSDQQLLINWINDPSLNINNSFIFIVDVSNGFMSKINLSRGQSTQQSFTLTSITINGVVIPLINGNRYNVQYVQQQISTDPSFVFNGRQYYSNTLPGIPVNLAPVILDTIQNPIISKDLAVTLPIQFNSNGGFPFQYIEFIICNLTTNAISNTIINFGGSPPAQNSIQNYDVSLNNYTLYNIACYVSNSQTYSKLSNSVNVTASDLPFPPTVFTAESGQDAEVVLRWTSPIFPAGFEVLSYNIYQQNYDVCGNPVGSFNLITNVTQEYSSGNPLPNVYTVVSGITNGQAYGFKISAINSYGEGALSTAKTAVPFTVPQITEPFVVTPGNTTLTVDWDYILGTFPTYYNAIVNKDSFTQDISGAMVSTATFTGLTNGILYNIYVNCNEVIPNYLFLLMSYINPSLSINVTTLTVFGNQINSTGTPSTVPNAPTNLVIVGAGNAYVDLSWNFAVDGGNPVTSYTVNQYLSLSDASSNNPEISYSVLPENNTYNVTYLSNYVNYWFRVFATNNNGNSPLSNTVGPIMPILEIPTPQDVSITQISVDPSGQVSLNLTWVEPLIQGFTVTGYSVYEYVNEVPTFLTTVGQNTFTYPFTIPALNLPTSITYGVQTNALYNGNNTSSTIQVFLFNPYTYPTVFNVDINLSNNSLLFSVNNGNNSLNTLIGVVPDVTGVGQQTILYSLYDIGIGGINTISSSGNVTNYSILPAYDLSGNSTQPVLLLASNNAGTGVSGLYSRNL